MANYTLLSLCLLSCLNLASGSFKHLSKPLSVRAVTVLNRSTNSKKYTISTATKTAFSQAQQANHKRLTILDKTGFTQRGNRITLKTGNSKTVQLLSKPVAQYEEEGAELSYQGKLTYLRKYVLQVVYYESSACLLIDQTSGRIDTLQNIPTPSPTVRRVAAVPVRGCSEWSSRLHRTSRKVEKRI
ncbi:hypothetical protein ACFST9_00905 [Hymenobacter monticola]|uniref:FTP domain-containing protein n=1 Tax=Hymenobacter monticola TaxID=1705399 RepID=A0ABY4B2W2_9BACT|nr:hypothetical protein [Hymenobacter monticola]UOE33477.1 hypothetical protein MTP16_20425 [Hymenobacter monticola]